MRATYGYFLPGTGFQQVSENKRTSLVICQPETVSDNATMYICFLLLTLLNSVAQNYQRGAASPTLLGNAALPSSQYNGL